MWKKNGVVIEFRFSDIYVYVRSVNKMLNFTKYIKVKGLTCWREESEHKTEHQHHRQAITLKYIEV